MFGKIRLRFKIHVAVLRFKKPYNLTESTLKL